MITTQGIDVSQCQGKINWSTIKPADIHFAIAKATEGSGYIDPTFKYNYQAIKDNNLVRGAYHFARTYNDPNKEALFFCNTVKPENNDILALDIEQNSLPKEKFVNWIVSFLEAVENATNIMPVVYTGGPFFNQNAGIVSNELKEKLSSYPLWLAAYVINPDNFVPAIWKDKSWKLWQCSGDQAAYDRTILKLPGTNTTVDRNLFKGDLLELQNFANNLSKKSLLQCAILPII